MSWTCDHPDKAAGIAGIHPIFGLRTCPGMAKADPDYRLTPQELK